MIHGFSQKFVSASSCPLSQFIEFCFGFGREVQFHSYQFSLKAPRANSRESWLVVLSCRDPCISGTHALLVFLSGV